jgi:membrane fusion protein (multidrug efflux system)
MRWIMVLASLCVVLWGPIVTSAGAVEVEAITMPQADIFLGFVTGGLVDKVMAKEGDLVKKGSLLAKLNDSVERIELERLTALAEDTTRLEVAEADFAQKRADLKKLQLAMESGAATEMEIEHAILAATTTELQVRMEKFQRLQHQQNRQGLMAKLNRMQIVSSVSGGVEEINIEPGESVEALAPVIRVVQNDPLWVDAPIPLEYARLLKVGSPVQVFFPDAHKQSVQGRIIYIATVADAASDTLRIRVEIPNPKRRMAGERVLVEVSQ